MFKLWLHADLGGHFPVIVTICNEQEDRDGKLLFLSSVVPMEELKDLNRFLKHYMHVMILHGIEEI